METVRQNMPRPRILIADDHALFLEALKCFPQKSYLVIGTVTDGRALVTEAMRLSGVCASACF